MDSLPHVSFKTCKDKGVGEGPPATAGAKIPNENHKVSTAAAQSLKRFMALTFAGSIGVRVTTWRFAWAGVQEDPVGNIGDKDSQTSGPGYLSSAHPNTHCEFHTMSWLEKLLPPKIVHT